MKVKLSESLLALLVVVVVIVLLWCGFVAAQVPISGLPAATLPLTGSEVVPLVQSGVTKNAPARAFANTTSINNFTGVDPLGVIDSTVAIQVALNTGESLTCQGTYKVSAPLLIESYTNNGQQLSGSGNWANAASDDLSTTPPPSACVFMPTSALSGKPVFVIDGTPVVGSQLSWVQGFKMRNLAINMVNMSDVAASVAINQIQAFDGFYENVRVMNDGANKRAWLFNAGAFTTTLLNTQGNILDFEGISTSNGVTTITVINHDGGSVIANNANSLKFLGGAFQGASNTKFTLSSGTDFQIATDVEGGGVYLAVSASANFIRSETELQGFTGTYMTGTPGADSIFWDNQSNFNTYPAAMTSGSIQLNNQGVAGISSFLSGALGFNYYLEVGRTGLDALLGTVANTNDFLSGTAAGDAVLSSWGASTNLWLGAAQTPIAKATPTGFTTFGNGSLSEGIGLFQPLSDTDALVVKAHAGTLLFDVSTSTALTSFNNNLGLIGYTGAGSGQTWRIVTSTGESIFQQDVVQPATDGASIFQVNNAESGDVLTLQTNATVASSMLTDFGGLTLGAVTGSTQCLHVNTSGVVSGTGADCASSGGAGSFTTLSASSTVSGAGFTALLASPPAIGGTAPAAITDTNGIDTGTRVTGNTASVNLGATSFQSEILSTANNGFGIGRAAAAAGSGSRFYMGHTQAASFASFSAVASGSNLAKFVFWGDDGSTYNTVPAIFSVDVTGTVSTGVIPTTMTWTNQNSTGVVTTDLFIDGSQHVTLGTTTSPPAASTGIASIGANATDHRFKFVSGTAVTVMSWTFGKTWVNTPVCTVSEESATPTTLGISALSTSGGTVTGLAAVTTVTFDVLCD